MAIGGRVAGRARGARVEDEVHSSKTKKRRNLM